MKPAILTFAAIAATLWLVAFAQPDHTCQLPCTIHTGLQEDEMRYNYLHGGAVNVYRVTP